MNLFELFVKIGVDDQASEKISGLASKLGNGLKTAAKIGTAAVGAAAAGITALTTAAVNNYAEYEQLVGGVETLFGAANVSVEEFAKTNNLSLEEAEKELAHYGDQAQNVLKNASNAYKTAGMSSNEYMSTVTSFSASLISSLGEYSYQSAAYADMAITDMADNANKMGTSMESIQNAYQGFAKQNYTMLDNLKLGYGGTKEEMQRLLDNAEKLTGYKYDISSFADIVDAIHAVQEEMGITGATALEAGTTIEGSVNSMKGAWQNFLTGLADGNADIEQLVDNLVTTIVGDGTEKNLGVFGNILPAVETALNGASALVSKALPKIIEIIPEIINDNLPVLAEAAIGIIQSLMDGISKNQNKLFKTIFDVITYLSKSFISMLPQIVQLGLNLIVSLANGIAESLPELIPTIIDVVLKIVETLTNQETLTQLVGAAFTIITELAWGLIDNIDKLLDAVFLLIDGMVDFLLRPANLAMLIETAIELVLAIGTGIVKAIPRLLVSVATLIGSIFANFFTADWKSIGTNLVDGLKKGISNAWSNLKKWFKNLFGDLIGIAKKILGIASPSKVFKKIGGFTAEGFGVGFEDEFAHVKDDMEDALNFDDASVGINASIHKFGAGAAGGAFGGTSIGNININIDGAKYSDESSLAEAIADALQNMTDRRAAVYA